MDSLLATYASSSSDDDDDDKQPQQIPNVSSLPQPKLSSLPNPSKLFSHLPQPQQHTPNPPLPKKVIQFKPPVNPNTHLDSDEDDDAEEKERKKRRDSGNLDQGPSVKSFLSSIPAPRNSTTLGVAPSSGSGRRSIVDTQVPTPTSSTFRDKTEASVNHNEPYYSIYESGTDTNANYVNYESGIDQNYDLSADQSTGNYAHYGDYSSYESSSDPNIGSVDGNASYGNYQYESNWVDRSAGTMLPDTTGMAELGVKIKGKRGRNDVPIEIVEVKQDELMKNRPREDQVKMTGIAFGPSYLPASTKGKPSKLHKRKHQISSLYFDMKQKEMELQERRSRGLLTKAETQAKYGW